MPKLSPKKEIIPYFGYGALASKKLIAALLGRVPEHEPAVLKHYRQYIQPWEAIQAPIRSSLLRDWKWKPEDRFARYVIRPRKGEEVSGMLWFINENELETIGRFELDAKAWVMRSRVIVQNGNGSNIISYTHVLDRWSNYLSWSCFKKIFINDYDRMVLVAHKVRNSFKGKTR